MKLDWADFGDDVAVEPPRSVVAAGFHRGKIAWVGFKDAWKITDNNPSGDTLTVAVDFSTDEKKTDWVFHNIPANWTRKIVDVCRCAGVEPPQRGQSDWDEQSLVGGIVFCETDTYIAEKGKYAGQERATVKQFIAPEKQPKATETTQERRARHDENEIVAKPQRKRSKGQPATPEWESDDIPF